MGDGLMQQLRFKCVVCGAITSGRLPRAGHERGDGTAHFPRRHMHKGRACPGNIEHADLITINVKMTRVMARRLAMDLAARQVAKMKLGQAGEKLSRAEQIQVEAALHGVADGLRALSRGRAVHVQRLWF